MKGRVRGGLSGESESARERIRRLSHMKILHSHTETRNFSSFAFLASFELLSCVYSVTVEFFLYLFSQSKVFRFSVPTFTTQCQTTKSHRQWWTQIWRLERIKSGLKAKFSVLKNLYNIFFFSKKKNQKKNFPTFFSSVCEERVWEWKSRERKSERGKFFF